MPEPKILIFGAGKIGRSFIGALFGNQGYEIVFAEVDPALVRELNRRREYPILIKGAETTQKQVVRSVRAVHARDFRAIIEEICDLAVMATAVGKIALPSLAPVVAKGLLERELRDPGKTLDIILAENMRSAARVFTEELRKELPRSFPLADRVGLVETSIGKMVPIMTRQDLQQDPLQVFAEPYNTLILDQKGFLGPVPDIPEFSLKENITAWVDRKAFIHNLGHATAAYCGHLQKPSSRYMYEVLEDSGVLEFTRKVMLKAADVLVARYPGEFDREGLCDHIDDLLLRFGNRNLGDTVFRVGSDLHRKLGADDRFTGIIRLAAEEGMDYSLFVKAMAMGFHFRATDGYGRTLPADAEFCRKAGEDLEQVLTEICGISPTRDAGIHRMLGKEIRALREPFI
jgi:mannitol-1-phosphate 5-dehydrogenase